MCCNSLPPVSVISKEKRWMHSTQGVHPPLHCCSQMLLFGGMGILVIPSFVPGAVCVHQGVSPCAGLPHIAATATEHRALNCVKNGLACTPCSLILYYFERKVSLDTSSMKAATDCRFYWHLPELASTQVSVR